MKRVLVLHGVNLNMLGRRDPEQYGVVTLTEINKAMQELARGLGLSLEFFQTNNEGELIEKIHRSCEEEIDAVIINAGAWTHYSYAIGDALRILKVPIIEVHMSNVDAREEFRQYSVISPLANGKIAGFGLNSYLLGLRAARDLLDDNLGFT